MPPPKSKQTKGNAAKKEQIAEKVKEIQQRQKNWLRQRDEHLRTGPEPTVKNTLANGEQSSLSEVKNPNRRASIEHTADGADILRVHHDTSQHLASQVSDKLNVQVKHGFGAWLQSRKQTNDTDDHNHSSALNNGEEYSSRIHHGSNTLYQENSALSTSGAVSSLQNSSRSYPLSPAEFDSLADSIAARVKKDLGFKHSSGVKQYEGAETVGDSFKRGKTFVQESAPEQNGHRAGGIESIDDNADATVDVSSHQCPFCSSLMATPAHAPMLLVPCGHTVCKRCSVSHTSCRLCGTKVGSLTANIMLQQIIQEFHRKNHQGTAANMARHLATADAAWERQERLPTIPPKTTAKHCHINYSIQLQSLQERRATLEEEASSCRKERDHIASKVKRAEKQVRAIEREEETLTQQIQQLQEQLQGLQEHKEEYAGEYHQLQEEHKAASDQVMLVEQTLRSLGDEMDKVQFLAEGQEDSHLPRQSQYR